MSAATNSLESYSDRPDDLAAVSSTATAIQSVADHADLRCLPVASPAGAYPTHDRRTVAMPVDWRDQRPPGALRRCPARVCGRAVRSRAEYVRGQADSFQGGDDDSLRDAPQLGSVTRDFLGVLLVIAALFGTIATAIDVDGFWKTLKVKVIGIPVAIFLATLPIALGQLMAAVADVGDTVNPS